MTRVVLTIYDKDNAVLFVDHADDADPEQAARVMAKQLYFMSTAAGLPTGWTYIQIRAVDPAVLAKALDNKDTQS